MQLSADALTLRFRQALGPVDTPLGLAVSGGGDSVALLRLALEAGLTVEAATVDHGLRPEAAAEADWVARLCAGLGVRHEVLPWRGWDGQGNLQDQARRARLRLLSDWAGRRGINAVALGHTRDDQAETILMRLARQAGVDGLSGMAARRAHLGVTWLRPLLATGREELRDWLRARGQDWIDDPSNEADRFERVRARRVLAALEPLGLGAEALAGTAARLSEARAALDVQTRAAAEGIARVDRCDVVLDRAGFAEQPVEIARRLLTGALCFVAGADYGPRGTPVQALLRAIGEGQGGPLAGCRVLVRGPSLWITREARAVEGVVSRPGEAWDGRWRVTGPNPVAEVRSLGEAGIAFCPDWRDSGLPREATLASPAAWAGDALLAAPLVRADPGWSAAPLRDTDAFLLSLLAH